MRRRALLLPVVMAGAALFLLPSSAYAYLGPGGVLTAIGALVALFVAIVASIVGFLWYPLKRLRLRLRGFIRGNEVAEPVSSEATKVR